MDKHDFIGLLANASAKIKVKSDLTKLRKFIIKYIIIKYNKKSIAYSIFIPSCSTNVTSLSHVTKNSL